MMLSFVLSQQLCKYTERIDEWIKYWSDSYIERIEQCQFIHDPKLKVLNYITQLFPH